MGFIENIPIDHGSRGAEFGHGYQRIWKQLGCLICVVVSVFSFLLVGSRPGINDISTESTSSESQPVGGGDSPCARVGKRLSYGTNRSQDLQACLMAYPDNCGLHSHCMMQPRRSTFKLGANITERCKPISRKCHVTKAR